MLSLHIPPLPSSFSEIIGKYPPHLSLASAEFPFSSIAGGDSLVASDGAAAPPHGTSPTLHAGRGGCVPLLQSRAPPVTQDCRAKSDPGRIGSVGSRQTMVTRDEAPAMSWPE